MNYHNILHDDMRNGEGLRVVLFVSGCNHYCNGCHNPITWDASGGIPFDDTAKREIFEQLNHNYISGITLSGGDPLYPDNRYDITELCREIKSRYPEKTIWLYTGYKYEEILDLPVLNYVDVLVDGEFEIDNLDVNYHWAGSTNQRVIRLK